eukprot:TRINITY_DN4467_c0_g1_i1.p1 TRINITY_DN4467_c0_g1~~TRINITY_DN4467_c0_g1_i1.p1  ORF type:complete len:598 (+),score=170.58 TRINITY_DN4467_c0_g1_i1:194-1987(+)
MEFKFRAGEDRSSSYLSPSPAGGYFAAQALRAGYFGSDLRRPDLLQNQMIPAIPAREALRRELEKERIREEIIAREILRKRELEEEVRRELAYEREMALRRQADRFSLAGNAPIASPSLLTEPQRVLMPSSSNHGVRILDRFSGSSPLEFGVVERLPISGMPAPKLVEARESEIRQITEVGNAKVFHLGNTTNSPNFAGSKRKAAVEAAEFTSPKKVKKEWSCALCQVSTTSEQGLNEHIQGKKHKAKEEELMASKPGGNNNKAAYSPTPKRANKSKLAKQGVTASGQQKSQVGQPEEQQVPKKENDIVCKQPLHCEHCKVKCNSESMLASHLSGKKHLARMEELERGKAPVTNGNEESRANVKVVKARWRLERQGKQEVVSSKTLAGAPSTVGVAKTKEELPKEEVLKANKPGGNNKGPNLKKADKSKFVKKVTSTSKGQQKHQVGQSENPLVPKKQNGAVKKHPARCEHCKVKCNSELMLECHLRGKKHLARMQELESLKAVSFNHAGAERGKVNAAVTDGNKNSEADDGKVMEVVEVNQCTGKQDQEVVASETAEGVQSTEEMAVRMEAPSDEADKIAATEETTCTMEIKEEKD